VILSKKQSKLTVDNQLSFVGTNSACFINQLGKVVSSIVWLSRLYDQRHRVLDLDDLERLDCRCDLFFFFEPFNSRLGLATGYLNNKFGFVALSYCDILELPAYFWRFLNEKKAKIHSMK